MHAEGGGEADCEGCNLERERKAQVQRHHGCSPQVAEVLACGFWTSPASESVASSYERNPDKLREMHAMPLAANQRLTQRQLDECRCKDCVLGLELTPREQDLDKRARKRFAAQEWLDKVNEQWSPALARSAARSGCKAVEFHSSTTYTGPFDAFWECARKVEIGRPFFDQAAENERCYW